MSNFSKSTSYVSSVGKTAFSAGLRTYMQRVYNLMGMALGITGVTSFIVASSPQLMQLFFTTPLKWVVLLAPLGFIFFMSSRLNSLPASKAKNYLWIFAVLMGLALAPIFMIYTGASITRIFFISASMFGGMSFYGYVTKKDLTGMGSFLMMGLIGIIIASIVNLFMQSSAMQFAISVLAVLIFTGLTAYDTQKIKNMYFQVADNAENVQRAAIMGALSLYMDFINLFIHMLHLFGSRR